LDFNSFLEDEESATTSLVPTPASDGELAGTGGLSKLRHGHRTTGGLSKLRHAAKGRDVASSGMGRGRAGPGLATASLDMVSAGRGLTTASTTRGNVNTCAVTGVAMSEHEVGIVALYPIKRKTC
jgi:hypothetical protein